MQRRCHFGIDQVTHNVVLEGGVNGFFDRSLAAGHADEIAGDSVEIRFEGSALFIEART